MNDNILFYSNESKDSKPNDENSKPELKVDVDPVVPSEVNEVQTKKNSIIMPESEITQAVPIREINNLFKGRTQADTANAKFPDWDIEPPNQFINPRIKSK